MIATSSGSVGYKNPVTLRGRIREPVRRDDPDARRESRPAWPPAEANTRRPAKRSFRSWVIVFERLDSPEVKQPEDVASRLGTELVFGRHQHMGNIEHQPVLSESIAGNHS